MKSSTASLSCMTRFMPNACGGSQQNQETKMDQREIILESVRHVAKLCAVAAVTAPKSGGQLFLKGGTPFIETIIVEDKVVLKKLGDWLRAQGDKYKEAIWYRDADTA